MADYEHALRAGTVLHGKEHDYRIARVLGQGTFGITYLAYTRVSLGGQLGEVSSEIQVAVKEFFMSGFDGREGSTVTHGSKDGMSEQYRRKFANEARNLGRMRHAGIVKVIEAFDTNDTSYYAMEYCGGGNLDALIAAKGGLPEKEALGYFAKIAAALAYMHANKMLHLDLKPGNIMLRSSGEPVLIDFGLSKQYDENGEPESSTSVGNGTPGYAPLEQANYNGGNGLPVTMDVYALGATLYKMLTGKRPPVASDVLIEFPEDELLRHGVSDRTIKAIRQAMQAKPRDRYQSVTAFAADLVSANDEDTEVIGQVINVGPGQVKREQERKRLKPALIAAAVGVVIIAAVSVILSLGRRDASDSSMSRPSFAQTGDDAYFDGSDSSGIGEESTLAEMWADDSVMVECDSVASIPAPNDKPASKPDRPEQSRDSRRDIPAIEMVRVAGGEFTMGATSQMEGRAWDDEYPAHRVSLDGFYIGKYEVTQKLWKAVMGSNPSKHAGDNLPVENVSWNDVQEFLRKLNAASGKNYRLPTEAEWEYAARGGNRSNGYIFSGSDNLDFVAWYEGNSGGKTHVVGTTRPNELGIYDMTGNVIEWVQDGYKPYSSGAQVNPVASVSEDNKRVVKGGSWSSVEKGCHVSFRYGENPSIEQSDGKQGFRLAL